MADQSVTWDDAVARLDATDHRPARRIARELAAAIGAAAAAAEGVDVAPLERRRRAARILIGALAVYRLAGGDPEHLASVIAEPGPCITADVAGTVGERGSVARARLTREMERPRAGTLEQRADRRAALDDAAAYLERPRPPADYVTRPDPVDDPDHAATVRHLHDNLARAARTDADA
jgi:hypothetical protein